MPIHDWSRVDAGLFHDFHQTWTINIRNVLNGGLLPRGYSALVEQHAGGVVLDVIGLQSAVREEPPVGWEGGTVVTMNPPKTTYVIESEAETYAARGNRITIRHPLGRVVCVMEIVSPGIKSGSSALRALVKKTLEFLERGIHLLIVDLFPPSVRDPQGIHKAIWDEMEDRPFALEGNRNRTLVAYVAGMPVRAFVEPIGVGETLPDMPAYLDRDSYVPVPLESTYQSAWSSCPLEMRRLIETGPHPASAENGGG